MEALCYACLLGMGDAFFSVVFVLKFSQHHCFLKETNLYIVLVCEAGSDCGFPYAIGLYCHPFDYACFGDCIPCFRMMSTCI